MARTKSTSQNTNLDLTWCPRYFRVASVLSQLIHHASTAEFGKIGEAELVLHCEYLVIRTRHCETFDRYVTYSKSKCHSGVLKHVIERQVLDFVVGGVDMIIAVLKR